MRSEEAREHESANSRHHYERSRQHRAGDRHHALIGRHHIALTRRRSRSWPVFPGAWKRATRATLTHSSCFMTLCGYSVKAVS